MLKKLNSQVILLSLMTMTMNISFAMVYSLSTLYLNEVIGASAAVIGFWAGLAEGTSYGIKLLSGFLADTFKKRKIFIIFGYVCVLISKPLWIIAPSLASSIMARFLERIGNGIQSTPAEIWVSDITPPESRASAYGFKRSLGMVGAFLGGVIVMFLLSEQTKNYGVVFLSSLIPGSLALLILIFFLKEPVIERHAKTHFFDFLSPRYWKQLPGNFWRIIALTVLVAAARTMEIFIVLLARKTYSLEMHKIPLIFVVINLIYATSSFAGGFFSQKVGRQTILMIGLIAFCLSHLLFAIGTNEVFFWGAVALWGIQMGFIQTMLVTLISLCVPSQMLGMALGIFYLTNSLPMMIGGGAIGLSIDSFGIEQSYLLSFGYCVMALLWWAFAKNKFKV